MANAKILKPFILKWEGGYTNDPDDSGGATNKGITIATYKALGRWDNNKDGKIDGNDLKLLTDSQWEIIFKKYFWDRWRADEIKSQAIANILVDWVWTSGKYGITIPQRLLGLKQDGVVGPKTLTAINSYSNQKELFKKIWNARLSYINSIAVGSQVKFKNGWTNRLNGIHYNSLWVGKIRVISF